MSDDIRVLLVKLADRLHNMRTLHFIKNPDKRRRVARETMEIYAPLAERIGMYEIKEELLGIAFRELQPDAFASISKRLEQVREDAGDLVPRVVEDLTQLLSQSGVKADVAGREKRPYSIWRKMMERHIGFEQLSDVIAFRVLVEQPADVYQALGLIHRRWRMVPGRFKDYISTPKRNGYRSLHTTVLTDKGLRIEIQLRTRRMHEENEYGVAAHWAYKQAAKVNGATGGGDSYPWLSDLLEILEHASTPEEFMEHTKMAMFQDQVFCFSPKGALINLPRGSTPVDFAYAVHTRLGDTCVGAKVNGRVVPLRTQLNNGDQVEILRSDAQTPQAQWESFVITGKARAAIRRFVRQKEREDYVRVGQQLLDGLTAKLKVPLSVGAIKEALVRLRLPDDEALYVALAKHTVTDEAVMEAILPGSVKPAKRARKAKEPGEDDAAAEAGGLFLSIKGLTPGVAVHLAECCHPLPGDRIVGIRTTGKGTIVHTIDCDKLDDFAHVPDRWIDLSWTDAGRADQFTARLEVIAHNEPGALATVAGILAANEANIANLKLAHRDQMFHTFQIDLEVGDLGHLTNILAALRAAKAVSSADRVRQ
jgi:GTP diphosphokinase / guanosine-3',5'-bis(diphosphate) 3'-diphosphatase